MFKSKIWLFLTFLTLTSVVGYSQEFPDVIRTVKTIYFKGDKSNHDITVSVLPGVDEDYRVSIPLYNGDAHFIITKYKITSFRYWLESLQEKFSEWKDVALKNNVSSVIKNIDTQSPAILCTGHSEGALLRVDNVKLSAYFTVENKIPHLRIFSSITDGQRWDLLFLDFYSEKEFQELISCFEHSTLDRISRSIIQDYNAGKIQRQRTEDLFK